MEEREEENPSEEIEALRQEIWDLKRAQRIKELHAELSMPVVFVIYPNGTEEQQEGLGIPPRVGDWIRLGEEGEDFYGDYRVSKVEWWNDLHYGWSVYCHTEEFKPAE